MIFLDSDATTERTQGISFYRNASNKRPDANFIFEDPEWALI